MRRFNFSFNFNLLELFKRKSSNNLTKRSLFSKPFSKNWLIGIPSLWLILFIIIPLILILKISLAHSILATPPYTDLFSIKNSSLHIDLYFGNYVHLILSSGFWVALWDSLKLAFIATIFCILIGYPIAYSLTQLKPKARNILFMLIILPYWTSFLLRAYAWINLLQNQGLINHLLLDLGWINYPLHLLYTPFSVGLGLIYGYLPYFILPVYAALSQFDKTLLESASDLGARPLKSFLNITLPISLPGVISGALLVFIPAVGEVVIPQILGGLNTPLIGNIIWEEFFNGNNWPAAAAISIIILIILLLPIIWLQRIEYKRSKKTIQGRKA